MLTISDWTSTRRRSVSASRRRMEPFWSRGRLWLAVTRCSRGPKRARGRGSERWKLLQVRSPEQLGGRRARLDDNPRRRLAIEAKALGRKATGRDRHHCHPRDLCCGLASETDRPELPRNGPSAPGRPRTSGEIEALVVRMAEENRDWGYRRIEGALSNLGLDITRSTIAQILVCTALNRRQSEAGRRRGRSF